MIIKSKTVVEPYNKNKILQHYFIAVDRGDFEGNQSLCGNVKAMTTRGKEMKFSGIKTESDIGQRCPNCLQRAKEMKAGLYTFKYSDFKEHWVKVKSNSLFGDF